MVCGIYKIENNIDKKVYIGSSTTIGTRLKTHKNNLKNNVHGNEHLQKAVNKYGLENFDFLIVQPYLENELIEKENHWINKYNSLNRKYGYNMQNADRTIITEEAKQNHLISHQTDYHRQLQKEISTEKWKDNDKRKNMFSNIFKEKFDKHESPARNKAFAARRISKENKELGKNTLTAIWSDQIRKEKMLTAQKNGRTEKTIEKISNNSKKMWARPGFQEARSAERILKWADPKFKEKMKEIKKANLLIPIKCKICEKLFTRNVHNQTICSKKCKYKDKNKKQNNKYVLNKKNQNSVRAPILI